MKVVRHLVAVQLQKASLILKITAPKPALHYSYVPRQTRKQQSSITRGVYAAIACILKFNVFFLPLMVERVFKFMLMLS
jgi:hypothetical protein